VAVNPEWWPVLEAWLPELQERIAAALEALTAGHDDIVAVAVFTDADASTLVPAALTAAHRAELEKEFPDYAEQAGWDPNEFDLELGRREPGVLDPLMEKVKTLAEDVADADMLSFRVLVWNWMVEGLKNLSRDGVLDAAYPRANVSFWITDYHPDVENMVEWIELLNPPERSAQYVAWLRENGL
jgi:hypothetical protein